MDIASRTTGVVTIHDDLALAQDDASRHADLMPIDDGVLSLPSYDSAPTLSDTQIKRTIEDRLSLSPDVDRSGITVAVTDGGGRSPRSQTGHLAKSLRRQTASSLQDRDLS
jgi:hypothetical protein